MALFVRQGRRLLQSRPLGYNTQWLLYSQSRLRRSSNVAAQPMSANDLAATARVDMEYEAFINKLNELQKVLSTSTVCGRDVIKRWLRVLGLADAVNNNIKYIHVAGTKGKGTTCLYCESLLVHYHQTSKTKRRVACLTSPHTTDMRDRLRIDGKNISKELFVKHGLALSKKIQHFFDKNPNTDLEYPRYLRFLTLLCFHTLVHERVDIAVVEVGLGGELDVTNVFDHPVAVGVNALGFDHVEELGNDIKSIAWHKAGIFKPGAVAFTVPQAEAAAVPVLHQRAVERRVADNTLHTVQLTQVEKFNLKVDPPMNYQRFNAALALQLVDTTLRQVDPDEYKLTKPLAQAIEQTYLPGRSEVFRGEHNIWLLNLAHNEMSMVQAAIWYAMKLANRSSLPLPETAPLVLIFNHDSCRNAKTLLDIFYAQVCGEGNHRFEAAVFCPNYSGNPQEVIKPDLQDQRKEFKATLKTQKELADHYKQLGGQGHIEILPSVRKAVEYVHANYKKACVVVAGSLYLNGAVRAILTGDA